MNPKTCSVVLSTYNWPEALDLCLASLLKQTRMPDEIIVADDGSGEATQRVIEKYKQLSPVPLIHVWQPDEGFKKAAILNKAIARATGEYIVALDGDIIAERHFVEDHMNAAGPGHYCFGTRVTIKKSHLPELFKQRQTSFGLLSRGIKKRFRGLRLPFMLPHLKKYPQISTKFRGCNCSFWRADFIKINGYNEDYVGWGGEDYELAVRFHKILDYGLRLKHLGIGYHIYHKEASKAHLKQTHEINLESFARDSYRTPNGIDKYLNP